MSNNTAPEFHYYAGSRSFRAGRSRSHRLAGNATARLARGAGLIAALLLSLGFGAELGGGFLSDLSLAFVGQGQVFELTGREARSCSPRLLEDQMPSVLNESVKWRDRAEQAREVAGQLTEDHTAPRGPPFWEL